MELSQGARMTTGAYYLKRGDTFDIEDWRMTHRLGVARSILRSFQVEPTWEHSDCTRVEWGRPKHACDYRCKATWPEWVTDDIFDLAFNLADEVQDKRGRWHQNEINKTRLARTT
jgi:hypothetical protein